MPDAQTHLWNFLSDTIKSVVRDEVLDYAASKGKLYVRPRLFNDLLSTQSLSFNLFAELQRDLSLASKVFHALTAGRIHTVTSLHFEHAPLRHAGDKSAFDVFVQYTTPSSGKGFAGITVKYHENLQGDPVPHRPAYDEIASKMACFQPDALPRLRQSPLQQLWRTHLLAGATKMAGSYDDAFFLFLYPDPNPHCQSAATAYAATLTSPDTFLPITLETFARNLRPHTKSPWLDRLQDRYLNFPKIDALLAER
jgi:hypothetical protein